MLESCIAIKTTATIYCIILRLTLSKLAEVELTKLESVEYGLSALMGINKCSLRNKLSEAHNLLARRICSV